MNISDIYLSVIGFPKKIVIDQKTYRITRKATTPEELSRGLSGISKIEPDECMLFSFPTAKIRNFWMKDCKFPISVIFLDEDFNQICSYNMPVEPRMEGEPDILYINRLKKYSSIKPTKYAIEFLYEKI